MKSPWVPVWMSAPDPHYRGKQRSELTSAASDRPQVDPLIHKKSGRGRVAGESVSEARKRREDGGSVTEDAVITRTEGRWRRACGETTRCHPEGGEAY